MEFRELEKRVEKSYEKYGWTKEQKEVFDKEEDLIPERVWKSIKSFS